MRRLAILVLAAFVATPADAQTRELLRAVGPDGAEVWWSNHGGLLVRGWPAAPGGSVVLGRGSYPRFDALGRLWFERARDDGHHLTARELFVLESGAAAPRSPRPGELPPDRDPPAPPAADGGLPRICVDPGHGGSDPGALGFGYEEADLVLDIALKLEQLLVDDTLDPAGGGAWDVLLTRTDDSTVSLQERVDLANAWPADRFVSIHANGFASPAANGTETYCFQEGTTAANLRDRVHEEMLAAWSLADRGTKTAGFFVLVNTTMPASLSETGFVTSPIDVQKLSDPAERQAMALAHLFGIQRHFGIAPYAPAGSAPDGTLQGILYDAALGSGAPIAGGTVALADGTFATTSATGFFAFPLDSGTYAFAATAPGFVAGSAQETVTTGVIWESLGIVAGAVPALTVDPLPAAGAPMTLAVDGDPGTPALAFFSSVPGLPLLDLGGPGVVWPSATGLGFAPLGAVPGSGTLAVTFAAPTAPGLRLQLQALVVDGGAARLSNGAAFEVR